nr:MAG TPA: hypothetical protein [Caudoviricetes sp.]
MRQNGLKCVLEGLDFPFLSYPDFNALNFCSVKQNPIKKARFPLLTCYHNFVK